MKDIDKSFIGRMGSKMGYFAFAYAEMRRRGLGYEFPHSMEYWGDYLGELQALFRPGIITTDFIGIHIRRGDFQKPDSFCLPLGIDYYENAIKLFPAHERFMIFAEDNYDPFVTTVQILTKGTVHSGDAMDAFNKMAGCRGNIIANSTFSYWAALINARGGKMIYPSRWSVGDWSPKMPEGWIKL